MLIAEASYIKKLLNISPEKKVIFYAPTWRGTLNNVSINTDLIELILQKLSCTLDFENYIIFTSLHHLTRKALKNIPTSINLIPDFIDITEFLSVVDILISDYSSIFIDFLCLDRPIILFTPDYIEYKKEHGLYFSKSDLPVTFIESTSELESAINNLKKPSQFETYNKIISLMLPFDNGTASKRTIDLLYSNNKPPVNIENNKKKY